MPHEVGYHWSMLNDYDRNRAYRDAIRRAAAGRVVYDFGAGVGPMSYYALEAGAVRVYGFEIDREVYPYLRRLAKAYRNFVPVEGDALRAALPAERPQVVVCEMWSSWLTDWPMAQVLNRVRRHAPHAAVIPACGHHAVQLMCANHRAGLPIRVAPGSEASLFGEPFATAEMSLPAMAGVTDFRRAVRSLDVVVELRPLTAGAVNAVRLYSYEEVSPGTILPRTGTRTDELLRWIRPLEVRPERPVRVRIRHRWDMRLRIAAE